MRKKVIFSAGIPVLLILSSVYYIFLQPNYHQDPKGKLVTISRGASFRSVVDSLFEAGVIRNKWSFELAGRMLGYTTSIKVGKFLFASGQSNYDILRDMNNGKSRLIIPVTIVEGWQIGKIANRFERDLGIDKNKFLMLCTDKSFLEQHGISASSIEGFLLPETYSFYWQTDEKEILARILHGFELFYTDSLIKQQHMLERTQIEILTLASIIEAESGLDEERARVAGVYWNRLRRRMRLQADPTIQYALREERRLRYADLVVQSPYNTYMHEGLPPGPINNPGKRSILAALYPEQHEYIYFVATGIGGHRFAKSYSDHQKNIKMYHRTRRELRRARSE